MLLKSVQRPEPRVIRRIRKEERRGRELWTRVARVGAVNMTLPGGLEDVDEELDPELFGEYEESLYEDEETLMAWAQEWAKIEKQLAKIQESSRCQKGSTWREATSNNASQPCTRTLRARCCVTTFGRATSNVAHLDLAASSSSQGQQQYVADPYISQVRDMTPW